MSAPAKGKRLSPQRAFRLLALILLLALGLVSLAGVLKLEEQDSFCASCHTEPETTYVQRVQAIPVDLASLHADKEVRCILCHSGAGLVGRLSALPTAAWDGARFFVGVYHQPARLSEPLHDNSCLQCHSEAVEERGFANHFHSELLVVGKMPTSVGCATCHSSHVTGGDVEPFLARATIEVQCNACHRERGEGPSEFRLQRPMYAPTVRRVF